MSKKRQRVRDRGVPHETTVVYSDRGYMHSRSGKLNRAYGVVGFFRQADRPDPSEVPNGVLIVNIDSGFVEISLCDPEFPPPRWLALSGSKLSIGAPSDGSYDDGLITLTEEMSIADAVDAINEQLLICCTSGAVPEFASHLGTTDGTTNGFLDDPSFVIGRVASPTSSGNPFYAGGWDNDTNRDLTNTSAATWELQGGEKITDLHTGVISGIFISPSGTITSEILTLDGTINPQSSTPGGYITVNNLANHPQAPTVIEGFISFDVPINTLLAGASNSGKLNVLVKHEVTPGTSYSQSLEFFKDGASAPTIDNQLVRPSTIISRYLSGVEFVSISGSNRSTLEFVVESPDLWSDTYRSDVLVVNSINYGVPNFTVNYNSAEVTKNGSPSISPYIYNEDFVYSGVREITTPALNPDENGNFLTISVQLRDPFNSTSGPALSGVPPFLLNSFPENSTDLLDNFVDERYRLIPGSGSITGLSGSDRDTREWDSTETLVTASGLQVVGGALIFPQDDWSPYIPFINPNYTVVPSTVAPGDYLPYQRQFASTISRTNGVIRIDGMTEADRLNKDIKVEIRVVGPHTPGNPTPGPGNYGTGWMSLNDPFNFGSFAGDDGDGCFVNTGGYSAPNFEFTLGSFSTAFAENNAIEVRISYPNTASGRNKRITKVEITNW